MEFDDSWEHEVYNQCDEDRVILIVDFRRPMPQPFAAVNRLVQRIMKTVYGRHVLERLAALEAAPVPGVAAQPERLEERTAAEGA